MDNHVETERTKKNLNETTDANITPQSVIDYLISKIYKLRSAAEKKEKETEILRQENYDLKLQLFKVELENRFQPNNSGLLSSVDLTDTCSLRDTSDEADVNQDLPSKELVFKKLNKKSRRNRSVPYFKRK